MELLKVFSNGVPRDISEEIFEEISLRKSSKGVPRATSDGNFIWYEIFQEISVDISEVIFSGNTYVRLFPEEF